jgi:ribonuclease D
MEMTIPFTYIDTDDQLRALADALTRAPRIALDTESNSLHAYRERVCLLQISTDSADFIIDPLAGIDLAPLGAVMANPSIEKVAHAAANDVAVLKRDFGFVFATVFDTLSAARICGLRRVGLSDLTERYFGIRLDKSHQRDNWGERPLAPESLRYAQMDTHFLLPLRDRLSAELVRLNRWEHAQEVFAELCALTPSPQTFDPEGYWRIALPTQLTPRQTAVLREVYLLRETIAQTVDLPAHRVLTDKALAALARAMPQSEAALRELDDLPIFMLEHFSAELLDAVERGLHAEPPPAPPPAPPDDPATVLRYTALREWRHAQALAHGVDADVIIAKDTLWQIAERNPDSLDRLRDLRGMGEWRLSMHGEAILEVLRQHRK